MADESFHKLAAELAHQIRNPLGGIKGFASLLQRDLERDSELYQYASHILEGVEKINHILEQFSKK